MKYKQDTQNPGEACDVKASSVTGGRGEIRGENLGN